MKGQEERARQCVEKGLVIQYCMQLGRDGVALYFRKCVLSPLPPRLSLTPPRRMTASDPKALKMFLEDVSNTSQRIITRAKVVAAERDAELAANPSGREQIQLVATDPSTIITFEVPEGPPPENLELTGEGSEDLDPVLVRQFLQGRWDIFTSFPIGLQKALAKKDLEAVNKVLGKMAVDEAEEVVKNLQEGGILSFESTEIQDQTGGAGEEEVATKEVEVDAADALD